MIFFSDFPKKLTQKTVLLLCPKKPLMQRYSISCSMRWCIVMHNDDFVKESWNSMNLEVTSSGTLKGLASSLFLIPAQNMTAASSLMLQSFWDMVAIHQPSTTPTIWTIQGCTAQCFCLWALVRCGWIEGLCITASLRRILHLEFLLDSRGASNFKYLFAVF